MSKKIKKLNWLRFKSDIGFSISGELYEFYSNYYDFSVGRYNLYKISKNFYVARLSNCVKHYEVREDNKIKIIERTTKQDIDFEEGYLIKKEHIGKIEGLYLDLGDFIIILKSPGLKAQLVSDDKVEWLYTINDTTYISSYEKMQERLQVADELVELWEEEGEGE